ncbi:MAG: hypothetical protein R6V27_15320, partial [Balneolaceae bacterium]
MVSGIPTRGALSDLGGFNPIETKLRIVEPRRTRSHAKGGWKIVIGLPVLGALSDPGGFNPI